MSCRLTATLCRRSSKLIVQIPYRPSTGALHLLIDSTGIKAAGEGEWSTRKHGASRPRSWRKVHLGIDAETMEVRAIEVTGEPDRADRRPMLPELLAQIPAEEPIGLVTADGAYDTRPCHAAIAARQARAVIPTRRNGRPWQETTPGAQARNEILRATRRLGRSIWRSWSGYSPTKSRRGQDAVPQAPRASASWPAPSTVRPPSSTSAPPSSTASPASARRRRSALHNADGDQGSLGLRPICSTEPRVGHRRPLAPDPLQRRALSQVLPHRGLRRWATQRGELSAPWLTRWRFGRSPYAPQPTTWTLKP